MNPRLILIPLITVMIAVNVAGRMGAGQGHGQSKTAAAARQSQRSQDRRQGAVRPQGAAGGDADARARLLCPWLHRGRGRAADQRRQLAGDAAVAQSLLGPSRPGRAGQAARCQSAQGCRLAGHPGRRHVAAARRADVHRTRQPSGRARRRHLADADAEPATVAQRARGNVGRHDGAHRPARHRSAAPGRRRISR